MFSIFSLNTDLEYARAFQITRYRTPKLNSKKARRFEFFIKPLRDQSLLVAGGGAGWRGVAGKKLRRGSVILAT